MLQLILLTMSMKNVYQKKGFITCCTSNYLNKIIYGSDKTIKLKAADLLVSVVHMIKIWHMIHLSMLKLHVSLIKHYQHWEHF